MAGDAALRLAGRICHQPGCDAPQKAPVTRIRSNTGCEGVVADSRQSAIAIVPTIPSRHPLDLAIRRLGSRRAPFRQQDEDATDDRRCIPCGDDLISPSHRNVEEVHRRSLSLRSLQIIVDISFWE